MASGDQTTDHLRAGDIIRLAGVAFRIAEVLAPFRYRLEALDE